MSISAAFWPALVGFVFQEALQWYKIFGLQGRRVTNQRLRTPGYWISFIALSIVGSIFLSYYTQGKAFQPADVAVMGASLPTLARQFLASANANLLQHGGVMSGISKFIRDYLV